MTKTVDELSKLDDVVVGYQGDDYEAPSAFPLPVPNGEYTFIRVNDSDSDFKQGRTVTKNGQPMLWSNFKVQIVGGEFDGRIGFFGANTLVFESRNGSSADDFIRASGSSARPKTISEYEKVLPTIIGPFKAQTGLEWNCATCEETFLKGSLKSAKAPKKYNGPDFVVAKNANGDINHVQKCPTCGQDCGAKMVAQRFVVTSGGGKTATVQSAPKPPAGLVNQAG